MVTPKEKKDKRRSLLIAIFMMGGIMALSLLPMVTRAIQEAEEEPFTMVVDYRDFTPASKEGAKPKTSKKAVEVKQKTKKVTPKPKPAPKPVLTTPEPAPTIPTQLTRCQIQNLNRKKWLWMSLKHHQLPLKNQLRLPQNLLTMIQPAGRGKVPRTTETVIWALPQGIDPEMVSSIDV